MTPSPQPSAIQILVDSNPWPNLISALSGAVVGGLIAAGVSYWLARTHLRSALASANRTEIYEPLLERMSQLLNSMKEQPYLFVLFRDDLNHNPGLYARFIRIEIDWWTSFTSGAAPLRMASSLHAALDQLESRLRRLHQLRVSADDAIENAIVAACHAEGLPITAGQLRWDISLPILRKLHVDVHAHYFDDISAAQLLRAENIFNSAANDLVEIAQYRQEFRDSEASVEAFVDLLESHIRHILEKYESAKSDL